MSKNFDPFATPLTEVPTNKQWAAKRKVSNATRKLIKNLLTSTAGPDELEEIASKIEKQADLLQKQNELCGIASYLFADEIDHGSRINIAYELNPVFGKSNPIAPDFNIWIDGKKAFGKVNMGWQYEGPPNCVHGGFIAAIFDQFLGVAQRMTKQPGFTGQLNVRYIKPTPLNIDLHIEGWVEKIEGRKSFLACEMWADNIMTARCEGIFISATKEVLQRMIGREIPDENYD